MCNKCLGAYLLRRQQLLTDGDLANQLLVKICKVPITALHQPFHLAHSHLDIVVGHSAAGTLVAKLWNRHRGVRMLAVIASHRSPFRFPEIWSNIWIRIQQVII